MFFHFPLANDNLPSGSILLVESLGDLSCFYWFKFGPMGRGHMVEPRAATCAPLPPSIVVWCKNFGLKFGRRPQGSTLQPPMEHMYQIPPHHTNSS